MHRKKVGDSTSQDEDHEPESPTFMAHWDSVIWMGDMNYRIQCSSPEVVRKLVAGDEWDVLTMNDQLLIEKRIARVGHGFREGNIDFAPTFKFSFRETAANGFQDYKLSRMPSWTDRILYRSTSGQIFQTNYDSNNLIRVSDHRPVFAQFVMVFSEKSETAQEALN